MHAHQIKNNWDALSSSQIGDETIIPNADEHTRKNVRANTLNLSVKQKLFKYNETTTRLIFSVTLAYDPRRLSK